MQETLSATPLTAVKVERRPDGQADIWLRKDLTKRIIEQEGGIPCTQYAANEVHLVKAMTLEEAHESFDALWNEAVAAETPQRERIDALGSTNRDLEAQLEEQAGAIEELAMIMSGGE